MKKLYCPVRRLEKPGIDFDIKKGKDNLLNINANIKINDPLDFIIKTIKKRKNRK